MRKVPIFIDNTYVRMYVNGNDVLGAQSWLVFSPCLYSTSLYCRILNLVLGDLSKPSPPVLTPRLVLLIRNATPYPVLIPRVKTPGAFGKLAGKNVPHVQKQLEMRVHQGGGRPVYKTHPVHLQILYSFKEWIHWRDGHTCIFAHLYLYSVLF